MVPFRTKDGSDAYLGHLIDHEGRQVCWRVCRQSVSPSTRKMASSYIMTVSWFHRLSVKESFGTSMLPTKELLRWSSPPVP